jgi:ATP-dependent RNA helicase RhlB
MLFSATLNAYVKNLAWEYTKEPVEIEIEPEHITVNEITQLLYHVSSDDKFRLLLGILEREKPETAIIFCNTKRYTEIISRRLLANGFENEFISGDLPQVRRLKIIENIKNGKTKLLIATDVAARGLDIEGLDLVVNYDLPVEPENYVHRIGRTARAGKTGKAIALASEQDVYELSDIEKYIEMRIPSEVANAQLFVENKERASRGEHRRDEQDNRRPRRNSGQRRERPGGQRQERYGNPTERRERRRTGRPHKAEDGRGENGTKNAPSAGYQHIGNLSFEERMAYYRQKYDKNNREGTRDSDKREKSRRGKSLKTKHRKADKEQRKPEESSKKPGLLARLTNLFKRKK